MAINKFADMRENEIKSMFQKIDPTKSPIYGRNRISRSASHTIPHTPSGAKIPDFVDWRTAGIVTPVKDQGENGTCYAHSAVGAFESQLAIHSGKTVPLSVQQVVDCTSEFGSNTPYKAYEYIIFSGLTTEALYKPRVNYTKGHCDYYVKTVYGKAYAFGILKPGDEQALQEAVATIGPISVCIQCPKGFWFYKGGITDDPNCKSDLITVDQCVLVVGYGTDTKTKQDYWLVKSSSGENWGEDGYVRMARNKHNQCAIATLASYPVITRV
ncbi:procathepsin L-like [Oppia nitens]|uniref:procathepsin L-like n=1 Tax=Oppia nitens TaxID=1686743 RepID=UPI0023DBDD39|nr:procathepsin L-like [Oppia nitens]